MAGGENAGAHGVHLQIVEQLPYRLLMRTGFQLGLLFGLAGCQQVGWYSEGANKPDAAVDAGEPTDAAVDAPEGSDGGPSDAGSMDGSDPNGCTPSSWLADQLTDAGAEFAAEVAAVVPASTYLTRSTFCDLDGDGTDEVILSGGDGQGGELDAEVVRVFRITPNCEEAVVEVASPTSDALYVTGVACLGDRGDGSPEYVALAEYEGPVRLYENQSSAGSIAYSSAPVASLECDTDDDTLVGHTGLAGYDFDGDDDDDLAVAADESGDDSCIFRNDGAGDFLQVWTAGPARSVALGRQHSTLTPGGIGSFARMTNISWFEEEPAIVENVERSHGSELVAAGDLDGDGDDDLAFATENDDLEVLANQTGSFAEATVWGHAPSPAADDGFRSLRFYDVDDDGDDDILTVWKDVGGSHYARVIAGTSLTEVFERNYFSPEQVLDLSAGTVEADGLGEVVILAITTYDGAGARIRLWAVVP